MRTILDFIEKYPLSIEGPAHIVLEDGILEDESIDSALELIVLVLTKREGKQVFPDERDQELLEELAWYVDQSTEDLLATQVYLKKLRILAEEDREELW